MITRKQLLAAIAHRDGEIAATKKVSREALTAYFAGRGWQYDPGPHGYRRLSDMTFIRYEAAALTMVECEDIA